MTIIRRVDEITVSSIIREKKVGTVSCPSITLKRVRNFSKELLFVGMDFTLKTEGNATPFCVLVTNCPCAKEQNKNMTKNDNEYFMI